METAQIIGSHLLQLIPLLTAITALGVGILVLVGNPRRLPNQAFFGFALIVASAAGCAYLAIRGGAELENGKVSSPLTWLRMNGALSTFFPAFLVLMRESLIAKTWKRRELLRKVAPWFAAALITALICFSSLYIPYDSTHKYPKRGIGYFILIGAFLITYTLFLFRTWRLIQTQSGIRRLELQLLVFTFGISAVVSLLLNATANVFHIPAIKQLSLLSLLFAYCTSASIIFTRKVYDTRQVSKFVSHHLTIILFLCATSTGIYITLRSAFPDVACLVLAVAVSGAGARFLDKAVILWLDLEGLRILKDARAEAIEHARLEGKTEALIKKFTNQLADHSNASSCEITIHQFCAPNCSATASLSEEGFAAGFVDTGWATPESLDRRRETPALTALRQFMEEKNLGLLVCVPMGSPRPSLIVALGTKRNQWPYTYPEILRIQNLAELMDNILTHSRLVSQAALEARIQHLALMSRGLAHDLKNLITPVSAFLDHAGKGLEPESVAAEVHGAARRSVRVMTEYVREALRFAERLQPKFEPVSLQKIMDGVRDATASRAATREVRLAVNIEYSGPIVADSVLLQRLLGNLVNNAIDASDRGGTITLSAAEKSSGRIRVQVTDQGAGIGSETLPRIFEPYFTTKEFGDDSRGFGLGLTIAQKIAHLHQSSIHVASIVGRGTTMSFELPVEQSASPLAERKEADFAWIPQMHSFNSTRTA